MTDDTALAYHPWGTFMAAREEARRLGDRKLGTEHLLLGLLHDPAIEELLGTSLDAAREALGKLDNEALRAIGLEHVPATPPIAERPIPRRPSARLVMANHIKMTPAAKAALQQAGRPMRRGRQISPQRVLRMLLENPEPDPAATLLKALNVDRVTLRSELEASDTNG